MAGSSIAITRTVALPGQPTTAGIVRHVPLGGDGFTAPHAAYTITGHKVIGDVSGGAAALVVTMDPRFVSLVAWVTATIDQTSSADADVMMFLSASGGVAPLQVSQGPVVAISATVSPSTVQKTWAPNPELLPGGNNSGSSLNIRFLNVDSDDYFLSSYIYLFDIRVRELSPIGPLLFARGAAAGSTT